MSLGELIIIMLLVYNAITISRIFLIVASSERTLDSLERK